MHFWMPDHVRHGMAFDFNQLFYETLALQTRVVQFLDELDLKEGGKSDAKAFNNRG